jgi:hypothetical protein
MATVGSSAVVKSRAIFPASQGDGADLPFGCVPLKLARSWRSLKGPGLFAGPGTVARNLHLYESNAWLATRLTA